MTTRRVKHRLNRRGKEETLVLDMYIGAVNADIRVRASAYAKASA
jgi:hypothetical protein